MTKLYALFAVLCSVSFASGAPALWVETSGTMILSNRTEGATKEIVLTGVRNETVSAQLALRSDASAAQPFVFEWTAVKGPDGREIPKDKVVLFRAADIEVTHGSSDNKCKDPLRDRPLGMFPDALVPLYTRDGANVANAIQPEKGRTIAFWVDIFIPAGTPTGKYVGSIALKADATRLTIPVNLTVANVEIPADATIPALYNLRTHPHVSKNLEGYVSEVMEHRLQPSNAHYRELDPAAMDRYNPNGKGFVGVVFGGTATPDGKNEQQTAEQLKKIAAHLKEKKLFDRTYLLLKDEPKAADIPGATAVAKLILREAPEWKGKLGETLSSQENGELFQMLDQVVRPLALYGAWGSKKLMGRLEWDKLRSEGKQLWFYVSNNQGTPYPTFDVNTPNVAFEPRIVTWMWWYEKACGQLYWDLMYIPEWKLNRKFPPGDGELLYPGDLSLPGAPSWALIKDIKGPVISRRMKLLRNGIQEWEMLRMAEKKFGYDKVSPIVAKVYDHMGGKYEPGRPMWSYNESDWDHARAELIRLLESK